jgi:hypothetical protein
MAYLAAGGDITLREEAWGECPVGGVFKGDASGAALAEIQER